MVADCLDSDCDNGSPSSSSSSSSSSTAEASCSKDVTDSAIPSFSCHTQRSWSKSPNPKVKVVSKDGTIKYNSEYHEAQSSSHRKLSGEAGAQCYSDPCSGCTLSSDSYTFVTTKRHIDSDSESSDADSTTSSDNEQYEGDFDDDSHREDIPTHGKPCYIGNRIPVTPSGRNMSDNQRRDKYLVFTMGMKTYTPHQIGIKRIRWEHAKEKMHEKTPGKKVVIKYHLHAQFRS